MSGDLTVYPIKIDHVPSWQFNRASTGQPLAPEAPWFVPEQAIELHVDRTAHHDHP